MQTAPPHQKAPVNALVSRLLERPNASADKRAAIPAKRADEPGVPRRAKSAPSAHDRSAPRRRSRKSLLQFGCCVYKYSTPGHSAAALHGASSLLRPYCPKFARRMILKKAPRTAGPHSRINLPPPRCGAGPPPQDAKPVQPNLLRRSSPLQLGTLPDAAKSSGRGVGHAGVRL